ncbi:MAG: PAS domain S-box protein [Minwuia sp.]|nr:PAS domain S-box protein [Minwuia sp.]
MSVVKKYHLAFEISPVPMLLASETGEIVLANTRICDLFEYEDGELLSLNVDMLVPESARGYHPELRNAYARLPMKRTMGAGRDLNGITKFGNTIPLELGLEPVVDGDRVFALVAAIEHFYLPV